MIKIFQEAVTKERRLHSKQVDLALSKLSGIETALQGRAALVGFFRSYYVNIDVFRTLKIAAQNNIG